MRSSFNETFVVSFAHVLGHIRTGGVHALHTLGNRSRSGNRIRVRYRRANARTSARRRCGVRPGRRGASSAFAKATTDHRSSKSESGQTRLPADHDTPRHRGGTELLCLFVCTAIVVRDDEASSVVRVLAEVWVPLAPLGSGGMGDIVGIFVCRGRWSVRLRRARQTTRAPRS